MALQMIVIFVHSDFIARNPGISIPYLLLISISTVMGCIGNSMVIGSVVTYKVLNNDELCT